jgi:class 3 adenylate cyclase/tetratricopeptide (TPR) repeat protein
MRCAKCTRDNPGDAQFCQGCGARLELICPTCATANGLDAKFCKKCGTHLAAATEVSSETAQRATPLDRSLLGEMAIRLTAPESDVIDGERKTVTALFADLKGSTELLETIDPEEGRAIVEPLLRIMSDAVRRYEGYLVRTTGDGVFALFGAPVAYEDHPQRALYAALQMQQELRAHVQAQAAKGRAALEARVGVHTGEVVAYPGEAGGKVEYRLIGHTANLAARMESIAAVGSIAVSEATAKLCEGYFELRELGPTTVKGVSTPVSVYEVLGRGRLRTHFELSTRRGLTRFVGRERELEQMRRALEQSMAGHGQIVAVVADAGTGKSRLFYEFKATLPPAVKVVEAHAVSHGKASAWLPVLEMLRGYFVIQDSDDASTRREKVRAVLDPTLHDSEPYLFGLLGIVDGMDSLAQMDPQLKQRRTHDAIKRIILRESLKQPLVIVFEDLHWTDDHTQALLDLLADSIANARVILLINYRPEYHHNWGNKSYYSQVQLASLDDDGAVAMLTTLLGETAELSPLKRIIVERTEGNPFFIEEMIQALFAQGVLALNGGVKLVGSLTELRLPPTVQGILAARIDRLAGEQKELLQALAVTGRECSLTLIRGIVTYPDVQLEGMLAELQNSEFIYERLGAHQTQYVFKHALTQEVAYNSLLIERRKLLHERVAQAMESTFMSQLTDLIGELAHHYGRTTNSTKAAEYLFLAGKQASQRAAHREAISHFREALERLKSLPAPRDDEQYCKVLLAIANEQERAGEHSEAQQTRLRVVEVARTLGSPECLANAGIGLVRLASRVGISTPGLASLLESTLQKVGLEDSPLRARILCGLATFLGNIGERERANDLGEQGLAISRRLGDRELLCRNLSLLTFGMALPWNRARLLAITTEMIELSKALNDKTTEAEARDWMSNVLLQMGETSATDRENEAIMRLAEELDQPFQRSLVLIHQATRALMRGRFEESEQLARRNFAIGQTLQTETSAGLFGLQMFALARERGQLRELEPVLQLFLKERGSAGAWKIGLALIYAELGRTEAASTEFENLARDDFTGIPEDALWMGSMAFVADICLYLRDKPRAATLYRMLLPFDGLNLIAGYGVACYGALSRYLGALAALLENWDDAARHFEDALTMNARMETPVWVAHTQYQYAMMLLTRGAPSDREHAFALLDAAILTANTLGMCALEERAKLARQER